MLGKRDDAYRNLTTGRYLTALRRLDREYRSAAQTPWAATLLPGRSMPWILGAPRGH